MLDLSKCHVQIQIDNDRQSLWINVDGGCVLKAHKALSITVEDNRRDNVEEIHKIENDLPLGDVICGQRASREAEN